MLNLIDMFFLKKINYYHGIISRRGNSFYPLGNIINRHEEIKIIVRRRKWSHKVNSPNVQKFYLKNPTLRHLMPLGDISHSLASITSKLIFPYILEESGPVKAYLKNFGNCLILTEVSPIC